MLRELIQTTVGRLVVDRPERARIFERFGIDYCCGGKRPLEQTCREKGVRLEDVLEAIEIQDRTERTPARDWSQAGLAELVEHIVGKHHEYLRQELPRLERLIEKVAGAHGDRRPALRTLRDVFHQFRAELEAHMFKEEQILFPMCRQLESADSLPQFRCGTVFNPIRVMFEEHDDAGAALLEMYTLTDGYTPPRDACNTYRAMLSGLAELQRDLHEHVHLENNILFPKSLEAEQRLRSACERSACQNSQ